MRKQIMILLGMLLLSCGIVFAAECGVVPVEDCTLEADTSYTFNAGTYNLADAGGDGAIIVNGENVLLDCNNGSSITTWVIPIPT